MKMTTECIGLWGKLFGHRIESIISKVTHPDNVPLADGNQNAMAVLAVIDKYTQREYRVVCSRCGMEIDNVT